MHDGLWRLGGAFAGQQTGKADVFLQVRPVNAAPFGNEPVVSALGLGGEVETRIQSGGDGNLTPVAQMHPHDAFLKAELVDDLRLHEFWKCLALNVICRREMLLIQFLIFTISFRCVSICQRVIDVKSIFDMGNGLRSDFLFANPTFWMGAGSSASLAGNFFLYNSSPNERIADMRAMQADFSVVANDLVSAMHLYEQEIAESQKAG